MVEDNIYCRFLEGFDWKLKKCLEKILDMLAWAKKKHLYTIDHESDLADMHNKKVLQYLGQDKEGRPILYLSIKKFKPSTLNADDIGIYYGSMLKKLLRE